MITPFVKTSVTLQSNLDHLWMVAEVSGIALMVYGYH